MTQPAYNLIREEWIPCRFVNGEVKNQGLRETLVQAHNIEEIYDSSPLVTTSLLRLMLAVLYRSYSAQTNEEFDNHWKRLWYAASFPSTEIDAYFETWQEHFNLFHDQYPFYQIPDLAVVQEDKKLGLLENPESIFRLHKDTPDVAISQLFDHRHLYEDEVVISASEAARLLIATQNYGTSSSQSGRYTLDGKSKVDPGGRQNGLLFKGIVCWLTGRTLKETLLLNWVRYIARKNDFPCWESKDYTKQITSSQKKGNAQVPAGLLEIITWQSRMVRMMPVKQGDSYWVSLVHFTQGRQAQKADIRDHMKFYLRSAKGEEDNVLSMRLEKASWRDVHALLQFKQLNVDDTRPQILRHLHERLVEGDVAEKDLPPLILNVSGFVNDQAKLILWRHDRLSLPVTYLEMPDLTERLGVLINEAEQVEEALKNATKSLCRNFLAPGLYDALGERIKEAKEPDPDRVLNLAKCLRSSASYWGMLETDFNTLLFQLAKNDKEQAANDWKEVLKKRAKQAFAEAITRLGSTPQVYKAVYLAKPDFRPPSQKSQSAKKIHKRREKADGSS